MPYPDSMPIDHKPWYKKAIQQSNELVEELRKTRTISEAALNRFKDEMKIDLKHAQALGLVEILEEKIKASGSYQAWPEKMALKTAQELVKVTEYERHSMSKDQGPLTMKDVVEAPGAIFNILKLYLSSIDLRKMFRD